MPRYKVRIVRKQYETQIFEVEAANDLAACDEAEYVAEITYDGWLFDEQEFEAHDVWLFGAPAFAAHDVDLDLTSH